MVAHDLDARIVGGDAIGDLVRDRVVCSFRQISSPSASLPRPPPRAARGRGAGYGSTPAVRWGTRYRRHLVAVTDVHPAAATGVLGHAVLAHAEYSENGPAQRALDAGRAKGTNQTSRTAQRPCGLGAGGHARRREDRAPGGPADHAERKIASKPRRVSAIHRAGMWGVADVGLRRTIEVSLGLSRAQLAAASREGGIGDGGAAAVARDRGDPVVSSCFCPFDVPRHARGATDRLWMVGLRQAEFLAEDRLPLGRRSARDDSHANRPVAVDPDVSTPRSRSGPPRRRAARSRRVDGAGAEP